MIIISQTTDFLSSFCQKAKNFLVGVEDQRGHHSRLNPPAVRKKLHQFIMDWRVPRTDNSSIAQISFKTVNTDSFLTGFSPNRPQASQASSKDEDHLSFVKSTQVPTTKGQRSLFHFPSVTYCQFGDERHNTSCLFKSINADFYSCWSAFCNLPVKWFLAFKKARDFTTRGWFVCNRDGAGFSSCFPALFFFLLCGSWLLKRLGTSQDLNQKDLSLWA